ncbi:MAG: hypothetical protein ACI9JL_002154 [Paracoccaceae bacterium]|jgi:hypothetical protein
MSPIGSKYALSVHCRRCPVLRRNRTSVTHVDSGGCCGGSTFGPPVARTVTPAKAGIPRSPCSSRDSRLRGNDRKIRYFAAPRSDFGLLRDRLFPIARNRARGGNAGAPAAACARVAGWPKTDAGIDARTEAGINVVVAHEEMYFRVCRCLRLFSVFRFPEPPIPTVRVHGVVFHVLGCPVFGRRDGQRDGQRDGRWGGRSGAAGHSGMRLRKIGAFPPRRACIQTRRAPNIGPARTCQASWIRKTSQKENNHEPDR